MNNPQLEQYYSQDPECPEIHRGSVFYGYWYGCSPQDEACLSSIAVNAEYQSRGTHKEPVLPEEIEQAQKEVDFIGESLQRRCDEQRKPFYWEPKNFEGRGYVEGYKAKKE